MNYHVKIAPNHEIPEMQAGDNIISVRGVGGGLVIDTADGLKVVVAPGAWTYYREVPEGYDHK